MRAMNHVGPLRRLTIAGVGAAALVASTGVAAHADSTTVKDRASDVVSYDFTIDDSAESDATFDEDGKVLDYRRSIASGVDLRTMRVRHGNKTVSVKLKFAELRRDATAVIAFRLDGQAEPERLFMNTSRKSGSVVNAKDKVECKVPIKTRTGRSGTISAVIDRSCLDDPERIKVAAISVTFKATDDAISVRQDVLSKNNLRIPSWTRWLKAG